VVHGSAGLGRTGLFLAALATRALGLSGAEAIQWVRPLLPHALETPAQQRLLLHDAEA
jgi:protein-tyrosine phosphatase